jgi:hypothetical protein
VAAVAGALLLASSAGAATFKFFGSGGGETQLAPANAASPITPFANLPYRTTLADVTAFAEATNDSRTWKVRVKLRADGSDEGTDQFRMNEGSVQVNVTPSIGITAGRVIEKWGTAYAWNPTAFVSPLKNPADPTDRRSAYRGIDMLKADVFARQTNLSLYAMERGSYAARVYRMIAGTDVSLHFRHDGGLTREGISAARVFGDALEIHAEAAHVGDYVQAVAGGQYTFRNNINVVLELYHGGDGMTAREWREFCEQFDPGAYTPMKMGRDYAFTRVAWSDHVELIAIANVRDKSSLARLTVTRRLRPNLSAYAIDTEFFGRDDTEFAWVPMKRVTTFGVRYYF